jgi:hypothetical protein
MRGGPLQGMLDRRHRIDDAVNLGDLAGRESAGLGVPMHRRFVVCQIDAEGLIIRDEKLREGVFRYRMITKELTPRG